MKITRLNGLQTGLVFCKLQTGCKPRLLIIKKKPVFLVCSLQVCKTLCKPSEISIFQSLNVDFSLHTRYISLREIEVNPACAGLPLLMMRRLSTHVRGAV